MKICLCSDSFLPVVDGVGRVVYQYADVLSSHGHECSVVCPFMDFGFRGKYPFEVIDFSSVKTPSAPQYRTGIAMLDSHYAERIASLRPDIIHAHTPSFAGLEAMRLASKLDVPLIGTFHSQYYDDFKRVTHSDLLATLGVKFVVNFYENCDEVWTVSNYAAGILESYGYRGEIKIVPNGSDIRKADPENELTARARFHLDERPILLYVGQIDNKKNLPHVIEACHLLSRRGIEYQLVFVGQGRDQTSLRELSDTLGVDTIFTGHIGDTDLLDGLYQAASLFMFPSLYDTAGLVVREAAVMGTASLVAKNSAPAECIQNGINGLVCEDDPESICDTAFHYLVEMSDREKNDLRYNAKRDIPLAWDGVIYDVERRYKYLAEHFTPIKRNFFH